MRGGRKRTLGRKTKRQNSFPSLFSPPSHNRCEKLSGNVYIGTYIPYEVCLSLLLSPWPEQLGGGRKGLAWLPCPNPSLSVREVRSRAEAEAMEVAADKPAPRGYLIPLGGLGRHTSIINQENPLYRLYQSDTGIFSMLNFLFPDVPSFCQVDKSKQKTHHQQQPGQGPNIRQENFPGPSCRRVQLEPATLKAVVPRLSQTEDTSWVYPWESSLPRSSLLESLEDPLCCPYPRSFWSPAVTALEFLLASSLHVEDS